MLTVPAGWVGVIEHDAFPNASVSTGPAAVADTRA